MLAKSEDFLGDLEEKQKLFADLIFADNTDGADIVLEVKKSAFKDAHYPLRL